MSYSFYLAASISSGYLGPYNDFKAAIGKALVDAGWQPTAPHIFADDPRAIQAREMELPEFMNFDTLQDRDRDRVAQAVYRFDLSKIKLGRVFFALIGPPGSHGVGSEITIVSHPEFRHKPIILVTSPGFPSSPMIIGRCLEEAGDRTLILPFDQMEAKEFVSQAEGFVTKFFTERG